MPKKLLPDFVVVAGVLCYGIAEQKVSVLISLSQTYFFRRLREIYYGIVDIGAIFSPRFICFPSVFPEKGAIHPCSCITELFGTSSANQHEQICAGKEHMEPIQIFLEPFVSNLPVTEVTFHNKKSVLNLTPNR